MKDTSSDIYMHGYISSINLNSIEESVLCPLTVSPPIEARRVIRDDAGFCKMVFVGC